jgi:predicted ferric reductase
MKTMLASLSALVAVVWGWDVLNTSFPANAHPLWIARQEALYLSGLLSIALMSLAMLLATRPTWLESSLGGMDRVYRTHKWAGILAISFAALHWLIELGGRHPSSRASVAKAACPRKNSRPAGNHA